MREKCGFEGKRTHDLPPRDISWKAITIISFDSNVFDMCMSVRRMKHVFGVIACSRKVIISRQLSFLGLILLLIGVGYTVGQSASSRANTIDLRTKTEVVLR